MTGTALVLHGHFYQPPREDPWTGVVPEQPGAAPFHDWNERITAECYRPNAELGTFEQLSFNVGPTLLLVARGAPPRRVRAHPRRRPHERAAPSPRPTATPSSRSATSATSAPTCGGGSSTSPTASAAGPRACGCRRRRSTTSCCACSPRRASASRSSPPARSTPTTPPRSGLYRWRDPDGGDRTVDLVVYDARPRPRAGLRGAVEPPHHRRRPRASAGSWSPPPTARPSATTTTAPTRSWRAPWPSPSPPTACGCPGWSTCSTSRRPTTEVRVRTSAWSCAHGVERWMADCGCHTGGPGGLEPGVARPAAARPRRAARLGRRGVRAPRPRAAARPVGGPRRLPRPAHRRRRRGTTSPAGTSSATATRPACCSTPSATRCSCTRRAAGSSTTWPASRPSRSSRYAARVHRPLPAARRARRRSTHFLDVLAEARSNDPERGNGRDLWHAQVLPTEPTDLRRLRRLRTTRR